jgi:hypothetical protein
MTDNLGKVLGGSHEESNIQIESSPIVDILHVIPNNVSILRDDYYLNYLDNEYERGH